MKRLSVGSIVFLVITLFVIIPAYAKTTLKMVTFLPKGNVNMTAWKAFVETVNEKAGGDLVIKYLGGPETIPGFKQFEALRNGVVDIIFGCESYYGRQISGAAYTHLTRLDPEQERATGYHAFRNELFKKHDVHYLGRAEFGVWFHIFTNRPTTSMADLKGQKIRVSGTYEPFVKQMGAVPVTLPGSDIYTALERGVIDGYAWAILGNVQMGWVDVCKYIIEPRIYQMNIEGLVNLERWKKLPAHHQKLLTECMIENEKKFKPIMADISEKEYAEMQKKGMEVVRFSPGETQAYVDMAYQAGWDEVIKQNPELGKKLQKMLTP